MTKGVHESHDSSRWRRVVQDIVRHILSTTTIHRNDRLWPADVVALSTGPLNFAFGACGTALLIHDAMGALPDDVLDWLLRRPMDSQSYPPGLCAGLAGIAYMFAELGLLERAEDVMANAYGSALRLTNPTMFVGAAGWGWVSIALYQTTGRHVYLERACEAGRYLQRTATVTGEGACWPAGESSAVPVGVAYGASGISLFLLDLYKATSDDAFRRLAVKALAFDVAHGMGGAKGLRWGATTEDLRGNNSWSRGTAGVASVLVRFAQVLRDERYYRLAVEAAAGAYSSFGHSTSQFDGLSGIGELCLDMYALTELKEYYERAQIIADNIMVYSVPRPTGIAFAGRGHLRICTDYATGSAGVASFFLRLTNGGKRKLHDVDGCVALLCTAEGGTRATRSTVVGLRRGPGLPTAPVPAPSGVSESNNAARGGALFNSSAAQAPGRWHRPWVS